MHRYSLYEMVSLLRLGIWTGGMVDRLDYIGPVIARQGDLSDCGLTGEYISYDAMLERCEVAADSTSCELSISLFDPYSGEWAGYTLGSSILNRESLWSKLMDVIQDIRQRYIWSHNINKTNIFHIERRYEASYSSMRSGSIGLPRKSKLFGR